MRIAVVFDKNGKPHKEVVDCYSNFEYIPLSKKQAMEILEGHEKVIKRDLDVIQDLKNRVKAS